MMIAVEVIGVGAPERVVRAITTDLAGAEKSQTAIQRLQSLQRSFDCAQDDNAGQRSITLRL